MTLTLAPLVESDANDLQLGQALSDWYADRAAVRRVWVIAATGDASLPADRAWRVIVMLEPSGDGDESSPVWMADGPAWARELTHRLGRDVQLERIDGPLPETFEVDGDGVVVATACWRDSTIVNH